MTTECFRIGGVILNSGTQEVTRDGVLIPMPPLSFNLLLVLARNAPNVVTTRQLEEEVWSGLVVDRGTINKRVLLVRNALQQAGCKLTYITVVRGTGYRMTVPVERCEAVQGEVQADAPPSLPARNLFRTHKRATALGALLLAVLALSLLYALRSDLGTTEPERLAESASSLATRQAASQPPAAPFYSVAVLPFRDLSETARDDYFAEGVSREITELLGAVSNIHVAANSSASSLDTEGKPLAEVARQLGVRTILEGSIHQFDTQLHIMARLTDVHTGKQLWAESFDGELADVFLIQDQLVNHVIDALQVSVTENERPNSRQSVTGNVEAFTLYLQGRSLLDKRIELGVGGISKALEKFWKSAEVQPDFVRAHIGIATANLLLPLYDQSLDMNTHLEQARASAMYALELDPASASATGVLANISAHQGQVMEAAALFRRATELGNTDANILHWQAMLFTRMGYFEELITPLENAFRRDPLNKHLGCSLANALGLSGQPQAAASVLEGIDSFDTRDYSLAMSNVYLGKLDEARRLLRDLQLTTGMLPARFADVLVDGFADPFSFRLAEQSLQDAARDGELDVLVAFEALLILGSPRAFDFEIDLGETAFRRSLLLPVWNNWAVSLRGDPRFKEWVRRLGYEDYWRKHGWPDRCRPTALNDFECI